MSQTSPCPQCPTCSLNHGLTRAHSPCRIPFEVSRVPHNSLYLGPRGSTTLPAATNALPMPNPRLGVVDLTESPIPSPCSSNPTLSLSPASFSSSMSLAVPLPNGSRPKSQSHPTHSSPSSHSSSVFPPSPVALTPTRNSRKPPKFILPSVDDREQGDAHDDSDDSDRTSYFSAEDFLAPTSATSALPDTATNLLNPQVVRESNSQAWGSLELGPGSLINASEHRVATLVTDKRDAAHALRRWHALMEIVHTEAGYVRDLRSLVKAGLIHF